MNTLPDVLILNIIKNLSFWNNDILNYKNTNKRNYLLCMKKISWQISPIISLKHESFFQKTMRYRILNQHLIEKLETDRMDMLIKRGWL